MIWIKNYNPHTYGVNASDISATARVAAAQGDLSSRVESSQEEHIFDHPGKLILKAVLEKRPELRAEAHYGVDDAMPTTD